MAYLALCLAGIGVLLAIVQTAALRAHLRRPAPEPRSFPFLSVLKPLCGLDDDLWSNLRSFARQRYPRWEILLGVKDALDPSYPVALRAAQRWPDRVRVILQRRAPGLNPKVNQLIGLSAAARGEVLVVSDSNVRVRSGYLRGIAAALEDPQVALVTHPVAGTGERTAGALFDNLTLCGSIAPGIAAARRVAGKDLVVGKSMALRSRDLRALGGFERLKDVLAEDFLCGRMVARELGKRVALMAQPVFNVTRSQGVGAFLRRYLRWSVMQRKAIGTLPYAVQILLNPVALAAAALLLAPERGTALAFAAVWLARAALHDSCARALRGRGFSIWSLAAPAADLLIACAWAAAFASREINWRGNRLLVLDGTRLQRVETSVGPVQPLAPSDARR